MKLLWNPAKRALKSLPYSTLMKSYHQIYQRRLQLDFIYYKNKYRIPTLDFATLLPIKKSDTVFLLGSGSSINGISDAQWRAIAHHDSFGFNFWLAHPHVPSLYSFECAGGETFAKLVELAQQRQDYAAIPKIVTNVIPVPYDYVRKLPETWQKSTYTAHVSSTISRNEHELHQAIRYLMEEGVFSPRTGPGYLFKCRASITMLITLAYKMGYKNIVLCGIDLNNAAYFYEDAQRYPNMVGFRSSSKGVVHDTQRKVEWTSSAGDIIVALRDLVLAPNGVTLYVQSDTSTLHPRIPVAPESLYEMG